MNFKAGLIVAFAATVSISQAQVASHDKKLEAQSAFSAMALDSSSMAVKDKPVVRVNGVALTDRDLLREMLTIFPYARTHNGFPKGEEKAIRTGALQMIEFEELVYQEAQRRKMAVPAAKLNQAEAQFRKTFGTDQEFQQYLNTEMHGSRELLRKDIRRSLVIEAFLKSQLDVPSRVSAVQVKAFYLKNPKLFTHPEQLRFQTISVMPPDNISAQEREKAHKRAEQYWQQAKNAKSYQEFGLLAEKDSEDDYRVNMGNHKLTPRPEIAPEALNVLDKLKPGQVSNLIQIGSFYCIFRLEQRVPAGVQPFKELQDKLQKDLTKDRYNKLRTRLNNNLRGRAKVEEL